MRHCILAAALALAFAAPAHAEPAPVPRLALDLVVHDQAQGVFEALPANGIVALRHVGSGLICRLDPNNRNRLLLFPGAPRGDDVACDSTDGRETVTLYATHYPFPTTNADQLESATSDLLNRFPDAHPFRPTHPEDVTPANFAPPPSVTARYGMTLPSGPQAYSRVSIAVIGDWTIMLRYTAIATDDAAMQTADRTGALIWSSVLLDYMQSRAS